MHVLSCDAVLMCSHHRITAALCVSAFDATCMPVIDQSRLDYAGP